MKQYKVVVKTYKVGNQYIRYEQLFRSVSAQSAINYMSAIANMLNIQRNAGMINDFIVELSEI